MLKKIAVSVLTLALVGCSDPKVDATSQESMKASLEKVRESLPEEKRAELDQALALLAFSQIDMESLMAGSTTVASSYTAKLKDVLGGKTGSEIIAAASRIETERKERERVQALAEIKELEGKKTKSATARTALGMFQVLRSRFYKQEAYLGKQPIIELTVRNGTQQAISRAYFVGTLASPGRSVPWFKSTFNYSIAGGIEPNEETKWSLSPNKYGEWGSVEAPTDAVFTVEVERLDGATGEPLFSTQDFTETEAERLEMLKKEYGGIEIRSDNTSPSYPTETIAAGSLDRIQIIGRKVWRGG